MGTTVAIAENWYLYMLFLLAHKSYSVQNELCSDESSQYWYSCVPVLMLQTGCLILLPKKGMKYPPPPMNCWCVCVDVVFCCTGSIAADSLTDAAAQEGDEESAAPETDIKP